MVTQRGVSGKSRDYQKPQGRKSFKNGVSDDPETARRMRKIPPGYSEDGSPFDAESLRRKKSKSISTKRQRYVKA